MRKQTVIILVGGYAISMVGGIIGSMVGSQVWLQNWMKKVESTKVEEISNKGEEEA